MAAGRSSTRLGLISFGRAPDPLAADVIVPRKLLLIVSSVTAPLVVGSALTLGPLPGVGAVGAVGAGLLVLYRPVYGAYALVALVPILSGLQRGLPVPGFRLSELMIVGIAGIILVSAQRSPRWGAFDWMALSYVIATAFLVWFNVIRHGDALTSDNFGTLLGPLQYLLLYRAILTALPDADRRARAIRLLLFASLPVSLLTLLQQFDIGGVRSLIVTLTGTDIYESTVTEVPRATGPFPHWHNLGGYLLLVLLLGISLLVEPGQRVMRRRTLLLTLAIALAALVQTASFAPLFGALVGASVIGLVSGQGRRILVWLAAAVVVGGLLFGPLIKDRVLQQEARTNYTEDQSFLPQTIEFRYRLWKTEYVPVIQDNFVTGYGPNLPSGIYFDFAESLYVTLLLRGGLLLLLTYLAVMGTLALRARDATRADDVERRVVGRAVLVTVPLLMLIDVIETYFLDSGPAPVLWVLVGLMGAGAASVRSGDGWWRSLARDHGRVLWPGWPGTK